MMYLQQLMNKCIDVPELSAVKGVFFARTTITKHHKLVAQTVEIYALTLWKLEIQDQGVGRVGFF